MTEHGAVHWNELNTRNVSKAKEFYKKTLGWSYDDMPMGGGMPGTYTIIKSGDKKVKDAGGMVIRDPFDVANVGRIAIIRDSNGAAQGWMTPAPGSM